MNKPTELLQRSSGGGNGDVVFVARQPIYNRAHDVFAYELLYTNDVLRDTLSRVDKATADRFFNTFIEVGLKPLVGDNLAFININSMFIEYDYCKALPKERVVLELTPDVQPTESTLNSLKALTETGYKVALDDFEFSEDKRPLIDVASFIGIDFERLTKDEISKQLPVLKASKAKLLAKRVNTHEVFEIAKGLGFEYFRGSSFNRPKLALPTRVPINRLSTLQLVLKLQEAELSTPELEKIVSQDVAISYKLLQYVNSAALSLTRTIESIRHAIQMVGTERIRVWASLLLLTKLDDKPAELMITALVRAKMAERLALSMSETQPESYYMVGLFSVVDALLNVPMPEAIQLLPFSKQVREALVSHEGPMGDVLACVLAYESGTWNEVRCGNLGAETIRQCYLDAIAASQKLPKVTSQDRHDLRRPTR
jgi:Predicted signal transduction protein containing EAL and modified HD-GYP domains